MSPRRRRLPARPRVAPVGPWGNWVDELRISLGWTQRAMYEALNQAAKTLGFEKDFDFDRSHIRRWIGGIAPTDHKTLQIIALGWDRPIKTVTEMTEGQRAWRYEQRLKIETEAENDAPLAGPSVALGINPIGRVAESHRMRAGSAELSVAGPDAADALNLAGWIESTNTSDDAIEHLNLITLTAARHHVQQPPQSVIKSVLDVHRQVQSVLQGGRQHLRQTRELFRIDAQLLAHVCLLLGDLHRDQAAFAYGSASIAAANEAGTSPAEAFSAQAQIARWRNRFTDAADLAAAGYATSPPSSLRVLLACQEANAAALAGDVKRAHQALARAEAFEVTNGPDSAWTCPPARQALYRLAVALHCGDPSEALHQAAIARTAWSPDQAPPFGTSAHIRIAAGIAHLQLGAVDAAAEQVEPVLELPDEYRLATLIEHMASLDAQLRESRFHDSTEGQQLSDRIADFMRRARIHLAPED